MVYDQLFIFSFYAIYFYEFYMLKGDFNEYRVIHSSNRSIIEAHVLSHDSSIAAMDTGTMIL